jgi:hypothetical protein
LGDERSGGGESMLENGMVSGLGYEETLKTPTVIGRCNYRHCSDEIEEGTGYEWDGYLYCSTGCMGDHLIEDAAVDLSA